MPHLYIEYTNNISQEAAISELLKKSHNVLLSFSQLIPIGGLRSRAILLDEYLVADGEEDDAFVHVTLKLGSGRSESDIKELSDKLFNEIVDHFSKLFDQRYLALSMEIYEFGRPSYKKNNIHLRYKQ